MDPSSFLKNSNELLNNPCMYNGYLLIKKINSNYLLNNPCMYNGYLLIKK